MTEAFARKVAALSAERDRAVAERDNAAAERDRTAADRDRIAGERNSAVAERDRIAAERDRIAAERDAALARSAADAAARAASEAEVRRLRTQVQSGRDSASAAPAVAAPRAREEQRLQTVSQDFLARRLDPYSVLRCENL